jgi:hypothetical protein
MWRVTAARGVAILAIELFGEADGDRDAVVAEGERLLEFVAPGSPDAEIRFGPIT